LGFDLQRVTPTEEWPQLAWWRAVNDGVSRVSPRPPIAPAAPVQPARDIAFLPHAPDEDRIDFVRKEGCHRRRPCMIGAPPAGTSQVVVAWVGTDRSFLEVVAAVCREWNLEPFVVGTAGRRTGPTVAGGDILTSADAIRVAQAISRLVARPTQWDVQHGTSPVSAVGTFVANHDPGLVTIPHPPHRRGRCIALALVRRLRTPVFLA
jgi:hypothetical protein